MPDDRDLLSKIADRETFLQSTNGIDGPVDDNITIRSSDGASVQSVFAALRESMRPAGVICFPDQPRLFVASSRLGALWLLRELIPGPGRSGPAEEYWSELAFIAQAADCQGDVAAGSHQGEQPTTEAGGSVEETEYDCRAGGDEERHESQEGQAGPRPREEDERNEEGGLRLSTQQMLDEAGLGTQEQRDWRIQHDKRADFRRAWQASKAGALELTVTNNNRDAERKRKRREEAEVARTKARRDDGASGGEGEDGALVRIPAPSKTADPSERSAWERLTGRDERTRRLILRVKQELEGNDSGWRESRGPRNKPGRPPKGSRSVKVMSYSVADRWLARAESVCREGALDELIAALKMQADGEKNAARLITDAQPLSQIIATPSGSDEQAQRIPASNQHQELSQQYRARPSLQISAQRSIGRLRAAADKLEETRAGVALAVARERLLKAFLANVYDEATVAIKKARLESSEKQPPGPFGHARTMAKDWMESTFADDPHTLQIVQKHLIGARRWQSLGERLGYGAIMMSGQYDLPNSFVEKDLNDREFQKWLDLTAEMHEQRIEMGRVLWEHLNGPTMMEKGDFSFNVPNPEALREVVYVALADRATQRSMISSASQGVITGETEESE